MANFSNCLQIVNNMPEQDQDALLSRLDELQAQGLSAKEAQLQAAVDVLAQVQSEGEIRKSPGRVTDTPEFKRWFGDSKVADSEGEPLVVYHGPSSSEPFTEFSPYSMGWFTPTKENADTYANSPTIAAYLSIENPLDVTDQYSGDVDNLRWDVRDRKEEWRAKGYDGVKIYDARYGEYHWVPFDPTQIKSATGNNGNFDPANPDIRKSVDRDANFKRWTRGLPVIEADFSGTYDGGPAVFQAYHGTTHTDITEFKNIGNKEGALGQGPYFSTSVNDVNENYAGVGPDLTRRIGREIDNVAQGFDDDAWYATDLLQAYFDDNGIDTEITDDNIEELKDEHRDKAIEHAATKALKGDSDGFVMPVYVRLEKPFNMATNPTYFEMTYPVDENGEPDYEAEPEGSAIDLINAINEVASGYNADADSLTSWVYENGTDGISAREVWDRASKDMSELYDDNGEMISSGQFMQEVAREMGFDGLIQDADLYFGTQRRGFGGIRAGAMKGVEPGTLHIMPFDGSQVKSATGNSGEFGENREILKSVDRPQFYSQLQRAIEGVPARLDNMAAPAWKQWLTANAPKLGVKAEEVEWSGLPALLKAAGQEHISKGDIAAYLEENSLRLEAIRRYASGDTISSVAEQLGLSSTKVQAFISWAGINRTAAETRGVTDEKKAEVLKHYAAGDSISKVQEKVGLSQATIHRIVKDGGLSRSLKDSRAMDDEVKNDVVALYLLGLNTHEVADEVGLGASTVSRIVRDEGVSRGYSGAQALRDALGLLRNSMGIKGQIETTKGGSLPTASLYEFARLRQLDNDDSVASFTRSLDRIPYGDGKRYNPDLEVVMTDGSVYVEEIKPFDMLKDPVVQQKARAAVDFYKDSGKSYRVVTERTIGQDGFDAVKPSDFPNKDEKRVRSALASARYIAGEVATATSPDIGVALFSPDRPFFDDLSDLKITKTYQLGDLLKTSKKLGWWSRSIGTQYDIAQRHPGFKRAFDGVQRFINDVSAYATRAADLAPTILPKLESWKDIAKTPLSAADVKALRDPIFGGTLKYTRDEDGNIVETDDVSTAGVVFKDEELREMFGLNDRQIGLYREFRKATNKSLSDLAVSDMLRYLGTDGEGVRQRALDAGNLDGALNAMIAHLDQLIAQQPERAKVLEDSKRAIKEKAGQAIGLMARGYAPLSRFGQYTVYAVGPDGEQLYFSMFENERDANKMAREMQDQYPDATVTTGTMSQESYKLFSGVTPETLALFGESWGLEESGVDAKSEAFQQYLKMAKTNRSAMKRLIERKGIDGFSEDAGRVLAGFVYSNARQISTNLHAGEIGRSVQAIDQREGDVKDAAVKLMEYVQNPREEAQAIRGLLFTQFIGGSIASAMVNMTQPFTMTLPYLSQFDGIAGASKRMAEAVTMASRGIRNDDELKAALKRGEDLGIVSPQEVHQLMSQAQGKGALQSGDGTKAGDAAAKINNAIAKLGLGWGKVFSAAEQFNRRVTFIAAYKLARDQGMADPMAFAAKAIAETQGVYNKGNKPAWARGAVGSTLFTFKQYSIGYLEFLRRMWGNGPEGKKAVGLALAVLFLSAGLGGMPGADDLDDVIDGFMQRVLGRSFDTKQAKKEFFASILGQSGAEFVMSGLSGLPGVPIDVSGRMGLGNLVPGTGFLTKKRDYGRDYLEIAGPAGTLFTNIGTAVGQIATGELKEGAKTVLPQAGQNFFKALDMATMGYYRDQKGRKVVDTDAWDAFAKGIGFQPRAVAQVQEATATQANLITQNKLRETEIADKWAQGRIEKDQSKIDEAKQMLADWNRNNPESPIKIDASQVNKRVQEANKTKAQRVAATAPKEIRGAVKKELERID